GSLDDEENSTVIGIGTGQNDSPVRKQPIHENGVLVPERLLAAPSTGHPGRPGITVYEEKCLVHFSGGWVSRPDVPLLNANSCGVGTSATIVSTGPASHRIPIRTPPGASVPRTTEQRRVSREGICPRSPPERPTRRGAPRLPERWWRRCTRGFSR